MTMTFADMPARVPATRIVCLGLSALDRIWRVGSGFSSGSGKIQARSHESEGGGLAATAAVAVARLGGHAAFWGRAGDDPDGAEMKAQLSAAGVDVSGFRMFPGGRSSVSGVIVDAAGERQIANFRGEYPDEAGWLPLHMTGSFTAVLADPRWPTGAAALFRAARQNGVPSVLDAEVAEPDVFDGLLPLVDHAIFSEPALRDYAGGEPGSALASVARHGCRIAAVTRGEGGVTWLEDGDLRHCPAFRVDAVDTTGAGDVFHGAYALAIGTGLAVGDAMAFAAAAAALKCTCPGGRAGIPTLDHTLALLRTLS